MTAALHSVPSVAAVAAVAGPGAFIPRGPAPALIGCANVSHAYRSTRGEATQALSDISLEIAEGEFVCLLGPSGCGKTTLLNMLAGFILPTEGALTLAGERIDGPSPDRGIVFQDYSLFPWLTVRANVEFGLRMAGTGAAQRRAEAGKLLQLVGLETAAGRYPFELSGGMKQRVAIARSLATRPRLLLMDEPFAALDALTRASLQAQLLEIHARERQTIIFVTHNIGEAIFLASRIIVLTPNPGRIVEDLVVDLERPRRRTTTAFNALYDRLAKAIGLETVD